MTIRIDTFRNKLAATRALLDKVEDHLVDLHTLAYSRHAAQQADKVRGGQRDYALDTHGDPKARELWGRLTLKVMDATEDLAVAAHDTLGYLTRGPSPATRRDTTADITSDELIEALEAQARRRQAGEYTPTATAIQPPPRKTNTSAELEALQRAVAKTVRHSHRTGNKLRPPKGQLTPAEQDAWRRAVGDPTSRRRRKKVS